MDKNFADSVNIGMIKTDEVAHAANKLPLDICGQTREPVTIYASTSAGLKPIHLGIVLIVLNLGVDCLIGEPGKANNNLVCLPKKKLVIFANENEKCQAPYLPSNPYLLARAKTAEILQPGDQIEVDLPVPFQSVSHVAVSPRPLATPWLRPTVQETRNGTVFLTNCSNETIKIHKNDHLADIRDTVNYDLPAQIKFPVANDHADTFQYTPLADMLKPADTYLALIQVDPDDILCDSDKQIFHEINKKFSHLFTPQPGRYSGKFGHIDNKLKFSTPPLPNSKTHIPNYSPTMNDLLAQKMDTLEQWGVLAKLESLGVSVEFVSPSLIVPKPCLLYTSPSPRDS